MENIYDKINGIKKCLSLNEIFDKMSSYSGDVLSHKDKLSNYANSYNSVTGDKLKSDTEDFIARLFENGKEYAVPEVYSEVVEQVAVVDVVNPMADSGKIKIIFESEVNCDVVLFSGNWNLF